MKKYRMNLLIGLATVLFSAAMLYETVFFKGDPRAEYYPRTILVLLLIVGIGLIIRNALSAFRNESVYTREFSLKTTGCIILTSGVYFYIAGKLGFYSATFLFSTLGLLATSRAGKLKTNLKILSLGVLISLFLFVCFHILMRAPVPSFGIDKIIDLIISLH